MNKRDLISVGDFSRDDINNIFKLSKKLKKERKEGRTSNLLKGKAIALLFEKPSTRTKISFAVGISELGGYPLFLEPETLQLIRGESIEDLAKVLSGYVHTIVARVKKHETIVSLAKNSTVPIINALSPLEHPCQVISDLFTILENKGRFKGLNLAWIGDGNNVCNSLLLGCALTGVNMKVACPKGYEPALADKAKQLAENSGATIQIIVEPKEAVKNADIIYCDTWISMGMENEAKERLKIFPPYQVNKELAAHAKQDYIFMHCLPAHRGQEVTDEIIDDTKHSIIWHQAENRLHAQKAILIWLLSGRELLTS